MNRVQDLAARLTPSGKNIIICYSGIAFNIFSSAEGLNSLLQAKYSDLLLLASLHWFNKTIDFLQSSSLILETSSQNDQNTEHFAQC